MKKYFLFIILMICSFCFVACSNASPNSTNTPYQTDVNNVEETTVQIETNDWGVKDNILTSKDGKDVRAYINLPESTGLKQGSGKIAAQSDETLIILDSMKTNEDPVVEGDLVENILPVYFESAKNIMDQYRSIRYNNFDFEVFEKETLNINGYEMCKYKGEHSYTYDGEATSVSFVSYATKLKSNGAYVYWMVFDRTEDQSLGDLIESHATNMAYSLYEQ